MKKMTEKEAWLWLAKKWDRPHRFTHTSPWYSIWHTPDAIEYCVHDLPGICNTINKIEEQHLDDSTVEQMEDNLYEMYHNKGTYYWDFSRESANQRMWACLFLAAMCE